jgi:2-methylisocitrate lyase-like PEP mutase family enzyme
MSVRADKVSRFRALHRRGAAFLFPNFWDAGSAKILEGLGYAALASTSAGFALTQGRPDYGVTREAVIEHGKAAADVVAIPVAADLENGFGPRPEDCATTIRLAATAGLAGGSIEDSTGEKDQPLFELTEAVERIAAAAEAARNVPGDFVLTARAEAFLHGRGDLQETIARLNAFADAGADVLFAPGLPDLDAVRAVCASVTNPVSVMVWGGLARHSVEDFANAGAARLSVGPALAFLAYSEMTEAAATLLETGSFVATAPKKKGLAAVRRIIGE